LQRNKHATFDGQNCARHLQNYDGQIVLGTYNHATLQRNNNATLQLNNHATLQRNNDATLQRNNHAIQPLMGKIVLGTYKIMMGKIVLDTYKILLGKLC
jgi:hypothetical protein